MSDLKIDAPEGQPVIHMERTFRGSRDLLFRAHTDPELYVQWIGPHGYEMELHEFDVRDGGRWSFTHRKPEQDLEFGFRGVFHGTPSPDLIVQTFEFEGAPGEVSLESLVFLDNGDGTTTLRGTSVFLSQEARDVMIANGMQRGVEQGDERLEALLAQLQTVPDVQEAKV